MKANNSIVQQANTGSTEIDTFSGSIFNSLMQSIGNERESRKLLSAIMASVRTNQKLKQCDPVSVASAALEGQSKGLVYGKHYYVVPYGRVAQYIPSYKADCAMAMATNAYENVDVFDLREGEFKGYVPGTNTPQFELNMNDPNRQNKKIIGYVGFYILKNGFKKTYFWSYQQIIDHADQYAPAFNKAKYLKLLKGELPKDEAEKLQRGSAWYNPPTSPGHMAMCRKTCIKKLLNDGFAPITDEMRTMYAREDAIERGEQFIPADDPRIVAANAPEPTYNPAPAPVAVPQPANPVVDVETGEVVGSVSADGQMSLPVD